ncbi:transporter of nicotinic acid [Suhomyces tanzawaensis NRRL Y-17324]|uniref:Transporter of nicotinic acid n=1 Tax=Suhomyces tanzawaensis NRRL Y-17324 TaxID=984487 RepID=A0A1E4SFF6_9ASCO|nr:transporter of nicotinic acid [Suhomyces tanzawaensis NRRL Y-17324]ODV78243.1 transporter of nicotinic acid [Suhomyces tanzawaensis NRRL Y-17324]
MSKQEITYLEDKEVPTHLEDKELDLENGELKGSDEVLDSGEAVKYYDLPESLQGLTQEELKSLDVRTTRKVDLRLMPMLIYIYILNYLDRNNIASARLGGLEKDLNLVGSQYQTAISILFVGYILFQIPSNMLLNKLGKPSLYISILMTVWGLISLCTGFVKSYGGLVAIRALLGIVESGFFSAALATLSNWYDRKSLSLRNSILYSGSLMSSAWSGLIAAGILNNMDGLGGVRSWRYLFYIEGGITVLSVPFAYWILPDNPSNTSFLSQQEKDIIQWKLQQDVGTKDSDEEAQESTVSGLLLALKDTKVWLVTGIMTFLVAACGVTNFFPSVVQTLNFNRTTTLCLTAPPYCLAVVVTFLWARHADKTGERFYHVCLPLCISLVSFIISASTLNTAARYFAMCIMIPSLYSSFTVILAWTSNCCPRPPAKRAVAIAMMNCVSNSTSIWNAYLYPSSSAPRYLTAFVCNCVFILLAIVMAVLLRLRIMALNRRIVAGTMNWTRELGKGNDGSKISPDFRFLY